MDVVTGGGRRQDQSVHHGPAVGDVDVDDAVAVATVHVGDKSAARRRPLSLQRHVLLQDDEIL